MNSNAISIILACFGRYEMIENHLANIINELEKIKDEIELILVMDNKYFSTSPLVQGLKVRFKTYQLILMEEESNLPAKVFNKGIIAAKNKYLMCLWAGCDFDSNDIQLLISKFENEKEQKNVYYIRRENHDKLSYYPLEQLQYGWSQCLKVYELNDLLIDKSVFSKVGMLCESKLVQKQFDWDFTLKVARNFILQESHTKKTKNFYSLFDYPYKYNYNVSNDIAHRFIMTNINYSDKELEKRENDFVKDLPLYEKEIVEKIIGHKDVIVKHSDEAYKIAIIGGDWEYVHNQLCFFNYFDKLNGQGYATYKVLLDSLISISDIKDADLVIFSRARNVKILGIIEYCNKKGISTLYMIDDNWFWVGKDWSAAYADIFSPGKPDYDIFLNAVKNVDGVLVYNKYLEEDVSLYAKQVYRLPVNLNLEFYRPEYVKKYKEIINGNIVIGYSGSIRYDNEAFLALSELTKDYKNITVLLFGDISDEQKSMFSGKSLITITYKSYFEYCKVLTSIKPLILIAPLDNFRTSMSKCPNKYLEIAAVGSVGIYSNIYPYNAYIEDGKNGIIAKVNTKDEWKSKMKLVIENRELADKIILNSYNDVLSNFSTDVVIKEFLNFINAIIRRDKV